MPTATEQQYSAELLRQRQQEQRARTEDHTSDTDDTKQKESVPKPGAKAKKPVQKRFPLSPIEVGLWLFPAVAIDTFEFFGQAVAAIPVVGWALAGASSVVGAVMSGIMFLVVGLWLVMKKVTPLTPIGLRVFLVLGGTAFGNAVINWLPAWSGFFLWLFFKAYKQTTISPEKK
ncbi:MAG: hypothetical protein A3J54_04480 [Candidatus Ryanbacteria bacterium RIFCSPHIGHO2_02_FULL_45_13b]|uniref:Uncharacterized protein n=1 Tax=Candidatus Ryanbacteria bacterium RIFCSPHIGHO2_02_FULL_45_13b TaxID=1802117 RepID=A0A1G2G4G1_9BACT|nr:MAG: hypothetical protein A3J54_04480 [Candidatus Ryanbacteria bacterium RIFCSPHIGHO2_02_FULL_45_13b]